MNYLENNVLTRSYLRRSGGEQMLILCGLFAMGLLVFRVIYTGHFLFAFLAWNLFLALIPYMVSRRMTGTRVLSRPKWVLYLLVWLLFVPNAFYIITDLFHLDMNEGVPLWYDLVLLLSFAWTGLLSGILSVRQMEKQAERAFGLKGAFLFTFVVMILNGFGVYIGRYLRFNSWDVVADPFRLAADLLYLFIHPLRNRFDWSMIVCYTLLLMLIYLTMKKAGKSMA